MVDDDEYKVTYVSPNIEKALGLREEDIRADIYLVDELAAGPDTVRIIDKFSEIGLGEQKQFEREYIHSKTGECLWFLVTVYHTKINDEKKYVVILSDRSRERRMNQTLSHALQVAKSANEAKSNFLANMSHDIRTPMNAILGFSALLLKNPDNPDKVREYTKKIISSGQHLLSLINDVLDMSKIESGKTSLNTTEFRLAELIDEIKIKVNQFGLEAQPPLIMAMINGIKAYTPEVLRKSVSRKEEFYGLISKKYEMFEKTPNGIKVQEANLAS